MSLFSDLKNLSIKSIANNFLKPYGGHITDLNIDKESKTITASIDLAGESKPVRISMAGVSVTDHHLSFKTITVDREWLNTLIGTLLPRFAPRNSIRIPKQYAGIIKMII